MYIDRSASLASSLVLMCSPDASKIPPRSPFKHTIHDKLDLSDTEGGKFFGALGAIGKQRQTL